MADGMGAAYELTPVIQTPTIDAGESIVVDLFVSGAGDIEWCYSTILHEHPDLLKPSAPGVIERSVIYDGEKILRGVAAIEDAGEEPRIIPNQTGCQLEIAPQLLQDSAHNELGALERSHPSPDGDPPIQVRLETEDDADSGDYELSFTLVYATESKIDTTRETVEVHVNTFREKYNGTIAIAIIAGALIALLSLVVSAGLSEALATLVRSYLDYVDAVGELVSSVS